MAIFVEWKWIEKTQTLLAVFHFWDSGKENLRMRIKEEDFETIAFTELDESSITDKDFAYIFTIPNGNYPRTNAYLSWAPSHAEFCLLTEILTYANLINGLKLNERIKVKECLQGRVTRYVDNEGHNRIDVYVHSELLKTIPEDSIVSFNHQKGVSFEVRLEYVEYLRKLIKPYIS